MEEAREKALQELTEYYEAKIKEKNRELKQASDDHEQEQRKMEEIQKQTEEDTDHEILTLKNTYERDLKKQIDANMKLRGELGIKTKKVIMHWAQESNIMGEVNMHWAEWLQGSNIMGEGRGGEGRGGEGRGGEGRGGEGRGGEGRGGEGRGGEGRGGEERRGEDRIG